MSEISLQELQLVAPIITFIGALLAVYLGHSLSSSIEARKSLEEFERKLLEQRLDSYVKFLSAKNREELLIAAVKILAYGSPAIISQTDNLYSALVEDESHTNAEDADYKNLRILIIQELKMERMISETSLLFRSFWDILPLPFKEKMFRVLITSMRLECYKNGIQIKVQDLPNGQIQKSWWQLWK